ncbi:MAG: sugar ABC transporter permease [Anaerolineae bacterium]|nr:sugar ABC transporter permease [Anaerolineae bacterium]
MTTANQTGILANANVSTTPSGVSMQERQRRWGWVFLSPWLIGFTVFSAIPIIASLVFTFTEFNLNNPEIKFVGLDNWAKLFNDPLTLTSLGVTLKFALLSLPVSILLPLGLATLLNSKSLMGKSIWRPLFYMPYIVPAVSSIFVWQSVLNGETGWINRILKLLGVVDPPSWLKDANWIFGAFILIGIWGVGNAMLTMLATMQGVPTELYEAAEVDGANAWIKWYKITLPMISPVIFYNMVLSVIGLMQYFVVPYIITNGTGQPGTSAYFFNMHLYKTAFKFFDMGYGATLAWVIFLIALGLTLILFTTANRWVYYSGGDQ